MNLDQMLEKYSKVPDPYIDPQKISIVASAAREAFLSQEESGYYPTAVFCGSSLKFFRKNGGYSNFFCWQACGSFTL